MRRSAPPVLLATALIGMACSGCGSAVTGSGSTSAAGITSANSSAGASASPPAPGSSAAARPATAFRTLTGRQTAVELSSEFVSALTAAGITPGTVGTARVQGAQVLLPVSGGNLTIYRKGAVDPYLQGSVEHRGAGFTLSAGGVTLGLLDLTVRFGGSPVVRGAVSVNDKKFATGLDLFRLDLGSLLTPTVADDTVTLSGADVTTTPDLTTALNKAFSTTAFASGLQVGTLTSTLTGAS